MCSTLFSRIVAVMSDEPIATAQRNYQPQTERARFFSATGALTPLPGFWTLSGN